MAGVTAAEPAERTGPPHGRSGRPPGRLRWRGRMALLVVVTLLAAGGGYLLYGSPWLRMRRLQISGLHVLTNHQVSVAAAVRPGTPLAAVDPGAIAARVRADLPRVASVTVERSWPDTLTLKVTERVAKVVLKKGGKYQEVDANGVRFAVDTTRLPGLPLVELTASVPSAASAGDFFSAPVLLRAAVHVASALPESVQKQILSIRVGSFDGISLALAGGRTVMWGSPEQGARKAVALTALLTADAHAVHYDVSAPSAPAAKGR